MNDKIITSLVNAMVQMDNLTNDIYELKIILDNIINEMSEIAEEEQKKQSPIELSPLVLDSIDNAISVLSYIKESSTNEKPNDLMEDIDEQHWS